MKPRIKSMIWNISKKQPMNKTRRKKNPKNEYSISSLWDNFICIIGLPGEEKEQEIGNVFEKVMK